MNNILRSNKSLPENDHVRCTVYDQDGQMVHHGKNISKPRFLQKYDLAARDLRKMVKSRATSGTVTGNVHVEIVPLVLTRKNCILLNLLNIRALIKADTLVIFENGSSSLSLRFNESHSHSRFLQELGTRLQNSHPDASRLPYEFRALEAILLDVTSNLTTELSVHKTVLKNILESLDRCIERKRLRYLLIQLKKLAQFHQKAKLIGELLDDLLEADDELNGMYLTETLQGHPRTNQNHQEVELLLESYYAAIGEIVQNVESLLSQIKTSEEIIKFVLDSNRNDLMLLGLKFSTGLLAIGAAMYISALYGMNLENFIEESDGGMEAIVALGTVGMLVLLWFGTKQLQKVQKLTMSDVAVKKKR